MWQPASPTEPVGDGTTPASASTRQRAASTKQKNPGRRVAQIVRLKRQRVDEYKACHAKVWPEVLKQIKDCNIEDCAFFFPPCFLPPVFLVDAPWLNALLCEQHQRQGSMGAFG